MTGAWTDVFVLPDGRLGQVAVDGAAVSCEVEGIPTWTQRASEALLFCRCAVHQGLVLTFHQGHDSGRAWLIGAGLVRDLGPTFGVQPVAIDRQSAYVVRSGYSYDQIDLTTGETLSHASPVPGSSQGISDINPTDGLWWADLHRSMVVNGVTFTYPNVRGPVTVGQADPPRIAVALHGAVSTVFAGDGYEPHVVVSGTRAAVCARTPHSAAYTVLSTIQKVPGPIVNEKEPAVMAEPLSAAVVASVTRYVAKFPVPSGGPNPADEAFENRCRVWSFKLAQQVKHDTGEDYGVKSAGGGRPQSKDSLTRNGPRLINWDMLLGVGTGSPTLIASPAGEDITGQVFIPVPAVDHVGGGVVPVPVTPPPVVKPPVDLGPLEARIAVLEAGLKKAHGDTLRLAEAVDILKARPVVVPPSYRVVGSTSRAFSHSHAIDVRLEPIL